MQNKNKFCYCNKLLHELKSFHRQTTEPMTEKSVPFADQLVQLANILHSDVLWLISGHEECGEFTEPKKIITSNQLNSWSADIGNCRMAIGNVMDCIPPELSAIGTLTIIYEKLDEMQEVISRAADKIDS